MTPDPDKLLRFRLLATLRNGFTYTCEELAHEVGASRSATWKNLYRLRELGLVGIVGKELPSPGRGARGKLLWRKNI